MFKFKIKTDRIGGFKRFVLLNTKTNERFAILKKGGILNELVLSQNDRLFKMLDGYESKKEIKEGKFSKGYPLIPFANRVKNGKYSFEGRKYQLPINFKKQSHAIHGFIYQKDLKLVKKKEGKEQAQFSLGYNYRGDYPGYPFKFNLKITYTLNLKGVRVETQVANTDSKEIPIGVGWHPFFKLGKSINNLKLKLPSNQYLKLDRRSIPTGKIKKDDSFTQFNKISSKKLDNTYLIDKDLTAEGLATTKLKDNKKDLTICLSQKAGKDKYNFLQVFTPSARNSIALEPMTQAPDSLNNKMGLLILKPDQKRKVNFTISVE